MLKDVLKGIIPEELLEKVPRSFDIIGSKEKAIAIIEIPEELEKYKVEIAKAIQKLNKNVVTVLQKIGKREGIYRTYNFEKIIGNETEVIHKEYGYLIKLDVTKVYFSPREATERQRIAKEVQDGEKILLLFSGTAPFAIAIAKKKNVKIFCVEINPFAIKYAKENVKLNKVDDKVFNILADARNVKFKILFDRIIMPLPLSAHTFLDVATEFIKNNGIIHTYYWAKEGSENEIKKIFEEKLSELRKEGEILEIRKVLPYAPRIYKYQVKIKITRNC
ncbi:MAG: class I SAM-dependent methyltransferase family protein [Candidatus Aenigmatarchaeota archaeon]